MKKNNCYLGIDLGTSGVKILLTDSEGKILAEVNEKYNIYLSHENWSEQNPKDWLIAVIEGIKKILINNKASDIKGLSFGGQMHGLVLLDNNDNVIRPCILWNDGRSVIESDYLNNIIGKDVISKNTGNISFPGFTASKILWLKKNEPENFKCIKKIMLPKDYLAYMFTGVFASDYSDASGMLLLDVKNKKWSDKMLELCDIKIDMLPKLFESFNVIGTLKKEISFETGLLSETKVIIGASDNAAAAIGTNTIKDGDCNISLGTSGTIFVSCDKFISDKENAIHSFCHANGTYHLMGCILSAASCRKWWIEDVLKSKDYITIEKLGNELSIPNLYFLPYLNGERSPHNDVNARGAFIGLSANTTKYELDLAIMEGVCFAIRDCLEVCRRNGINPKHSTLCGGGAKSIIWRNMITNVLNIPIKILKTEQGPAYGACILAMVGNHEYKNIEEAVKKIVEVKEIIYPNKEKIDYYENKYKKYKKLYPLLKEIENA